MHSAPLLVPLNDEKAELNERVAEDERDSGAAVPWEEAIAPVGRELDIERSRAREQRVRRPVVVAPIARRDVEHAAPWYERQREGLGVEFTDAAPARSVDCPTAPSTIRWCTATMTS